jgi:hypothetical protein
VLEGRCSTPPRRLYSGLEEAAIVTSDPERSAQAGRDYPDAAILVSADELFAMDGTLAGLTTLRWSTDGREHMRTSTGASLPH